MRLPASQARALTRGAASTLRVPVDRRLIPPLRPAGRHSGRPFLPQTGETYPVHGGVYTLTDGRWRWMTTSPVHVLVKARHMGELGHLTLEQATAEGYGSVEEFEIAWVDHHEHAWIERQVQTLVEAGAEDAEETRDWWARNRYENRWATAQVWVLTVQAVHDLPRLLPEERGTPRVHDTPDERARVGDEGYTHTASAAMDDLDAIPVDRLDPTWKTWAGARHKKAQRATLKARLESCETLEQRVSLIRDEARRQGLDIRDELRAIDRRLTRVVRALDQPDRDAA